MFFNDFGGFRGSKLEPKSIKNRSIMVSKTRSNFQWVLDSSWIDFGPILIGFWSQVGAKLALKSVQEGPSWAKMAPSWTKLEPSSSKLDFGPTWGPLDSSWIDFGPILDKFWTQVGAKVAQKVQEGPSWGQDGAKLAQDGAKMEPF